MENYWLVVCLFFFPYIGKNVKMLSEQINEEKNVSSLEEILEKNPQLIEK